MTENPQVRHMIEEIRKRGNSLENIHCELMIAPLDGAAFLGSAERLQEIVNRATDAIIADTGLGPVVEAYGLSRQGVMGLYFIAFAAAGEEKFCSDAVTTLTMIFCYPDAFAGLIDFIGKMGEHARNAGLQTGTDLTREIVRKFYFHQRKKIAAVSAPLPPT